MTAQVVKNVLTLPDGTPLAGASVIVELIASTTSQAEGFVAAGGILGRTVATSDATGAWQMSLTPNSLITPANTVYRVTESLGDFRASNTISVPASGGPYLVGAILAPAPGALTPPGSASTADLSAETARATAQEALALKIANNLTDVASPSAARTALGLGTAATQASSAFDASGAASTAQAAAIAAAATDATSKVAAANALHRGLWATTTVYAVGDTVQITVANANGYRYGLWKCLVGHTSGATFSGTSVGNWVRLAGDLDTTTATATYVAQISRIAAVADPPAAALTSGDVLKATAPNADTYLTLVTPDGTGQLTHMSVVYKSGGWNGYSYWGVATPYANANNQVENPCVYASVDGVTWVVPAGLTNPIEPTPSGGNYNSDPDLCFSSDGVTLYCFWRQYLGGNPGSDERIYAKSSTDGVTWGNKTLLISSDATTTRLVSPSVLYDGSQYVMYLVNFQPDPNTLLRYTATNPLGTWTGPTTVTLAGLPNFPATREPWHIEVCKWGTRYHMLINDSDRNQSGSQGSLYLADSADGLTFISASTPLLQKRTGNFDANFYRSTMVPAAIGGRFGYEIWYAGVGAGPVYRIARTFAPLGVPQKVYGGANDSGVPIHAAALTAARVPVSPFLFGDSSRRADSATSLGTSDSGQAYTAATGTLGISSNQFYAPGAGNNKAIVGLTGCADGVFAVEFSVMSPTAYLLLRYTDASNFIRLGYAGGAALVMDNFVAGAVSQTVAITPATGLANGDVIAVKASGSQLWVYQNGVLIGAVDNWTANAAASGVGVQITTTAARIRNLYARPLVNGV